MNTPPQEQPQGRRTVAAFSGGKDSTAMVLLMAERGEDFGLLFTPTGDESPECIDHIRSIVERAGKSFVVRWSGHSLSSLIEKWNALPNWRQRWCTRALKIDPCPRCGLPLKRLPGAFWWRGVAADGAYCEPCNSLWAITGEEIPPLRAIPVNE